MGTFWVSRVEQELLTLPEHLSSLSVLCGARSLVFCVLFFFFFLLAIVLLVLLQFKASENRFWGLQLFYLVLKQTINYRFVQLQRYPLLILCFMDHGIDTPHITCKHLSGTTIKTQISNLVCLTPFWNDLHQIRSSSNHW